MRRTVNQIVEDTDRHIKEQEDWLVRTDPIMNAIGLTLFAIAGTVVLVACIAGLLIIGKLLGY